MKTTNGNNGNHSCSSIKSLIIDSLSTVINICIRIAIISQLRNSLAKSPGSKILVQLPWNPSDPPIFNTYLAVSCKTTVN